MNWTDSLSVDVVSLDQEHQALADALDDLFGTLRRNGDRDRFIAGIDGVIGMVAAHFTHEERVMRNIGLPDYESHCRLHRALMEEIRTFRTEQAASFDPAAMEPAEQFLRFWLYRHIIAEDHKIASHLNRM